MTIKKAVFFLYIYIIYHLFAVVKEQFYSLCYRAFIEDLSIVLMFWLTIKNFTLDIWLNWRNCFDSWNKGKNVKKWT